MLVLVSMGPVAALVGPPSFLIWAASAVIGLLMALAFAELIAAYPKESGGIGMLAARVLQSGHPRLALLSRWSYWFGWCPALAINSLLFGTYLQQILVPKTPGWISALFAGAVLASSFTLNTFGLRHSASLQVVLAACVAVGVALLTIGPLVAGQFDLHNLTPFAPPGGWTSATGLIAIGGALFIAGWSAYGSELALSYGSEYSGGARAAVGVMVAIAIVSVITYAAVPLVLVGTVGVARIQEDPAIALIPLVQHAARGFGALVLGLLMAGLWLSLNMIMISSSRLVYQMARNGDSWLTLGQLNRHGAPANAMRFDLSVNLMLLAIIVAVNGGRTAGVPLALLAASNVGYFIAIILALVAASMVHRRHSSEPGGFRMRPGVIRLGVFLAGVNAVLLVCGGFAWGWLQLGTGALLLGVVIIIFARSTGRARGALTVRQMVRCMAWGLRGRTATSEELSMLSKISAKTSPADQDDASF